MKNIVLVTLLSLFAFSCKDDDNVTPAPSISGLEVGYDNVKTVQRGTDLHVEAQILAEAGIEEVEIEIHKETGTGWEFHKHFDDLKNQKNGEIHTHIDIPADASTGDYHLHITVVDKNGKSTKVESELSITE